MKRMTLKTMTRSGIPDVNKIVYSKDEFDKMVKNINGVQIKLTTGSFYNKDYIKNYQDFIKDLYLDIPNILGDVVEIKDGEISVDIYDDKLDVLKDAINKGFKPGMRYIGNVNVSKRGNDNIATVTDMKLICYDMVIDKEV